APAGGAAGVRSGPRRLDPRRPRHGSCRRRTCTLMTSTDQDAARTLYGHLRDWAAETPDRVLVTQLDPGDLGTTRVTAAALLARTHTLAAWLRARGVGAGDCV